MTGPVPTTTSQDSSHRNAEAAYGVSFHSMTSLSAALVLLAVGVLVQAYSGSSAFDYERLSKREVPGQAQVIDWKSFNVLPTVSPPSVANATTFFFIPPGHDLESLKEKPFHIYDDEFYDVIGPNPTLTLIANAGTNPIFHEAPVWYPPTDEMFFVQNAGAAAAGTGLNKSNIILKIALSEAATVSNIRNATGSVNVQTVDVPAIINSNGGTNYKGEIVFAAEGQGDDATSQLVVMNPREPYNTTILLNNYFGRQFNSLNDAAVNPRNKELYFSDSLYGYLQNFRPAPGLRTQIYRYNPETGAVAAVADGFGVNNGLTFSPNGSHAYVTDTGANKAVLGWNFSEPASIYRFDVQEDGTWDNRRLFAYADTGVPDGIHCDSNGNVYSGCGDGVQVWNPSGKLIGKIFLGKTAANFNFAGDGRMVILAEEDLYYATLGASGGGYIEDV
ncbi:calcium-dependent phosphotriesterase [Daldinia decipiens]|uniref:calcium-dependent phosphotriesterase n=1 Tax=Daldinia decipiens TaxID=326647 RepID=UPI0020C382EB|nr:calcium-dependent phosphotriesterase [Daldinia decipiens]KAI1657946.1 calcium-dependent phosphotriesterase [Daldinia decipiens]